MLSYLQSRRPNSRRSALPPPDNQVCLNSSRRYHHATESAGSDRSSPPSAPPTRNTLNDPSRISSTPPLLPPIPHVASQLRSYTDAPQGVEQGHWSFRGDSSLPTLPSSRSKLSFAKRFEDRPTLATGASERQQPLSIATEHVSQDTGRGKRAIDLRFEEMRSRPPQAFHQSIYTQQDRPHSIHPAFDPPTPPPRALPATLPISSNVLPAQSSEVAASRPPESRYRTWNQKVFDHAQTPINEDAARSETTHSNSHLTQPRQGKPKLNLRNPIALLARRRSHQVVQAAYQENQGSSALQLSPDFDPRIRGKGIHDFNAPRPGQSQGPTLGADGSHLQQREARNSTVRERKSRPSSQDREHSPVFKEQFDDGLENSQDPANRSSAFLQQMAIQASQSQPDPSSLPAFARKLPSQISSDVDEADLQSQQQPHGPLEILLEPPDKDQTPALPSPPMSPPRAASTPASLSDQTSQGLGSPKRYTSNASRFSFDLAGVGSAAQEKLLEDKHRQKAQQKQRQSVQSDDDMDDDELDMNYDAMEDGGFEERIPGVNCDDVVDNDDMATQSAMPVLQRDMETFNMVSPNKSSFESTASPGSTGDTSLYTPKDIGGQPASFAASKSSPNLARHKVRTNPEGGDQTKHGRPRSTPGGSWIAAPAAQNLQREVASESNLAGLPQRQSYLDDDLYFDDGMIDDLGETSDQDFDEDVFDDASHGLYGLPLRDRTLKPLPEPEIATGSESGPTSQHSLRLKAADPTLSPHRSISSGGVSAELRDALTELNQTSRPIFSHTAGLTQDNLAAYNHNALHMATNQVALDGAFDRTSSLQDFQSPLLDGGVSENMDRENTQMDSGVREPPVSDEYGDDYGDDYGNEALDDDAIVAAANAEALENDDDGFYGQEFGFYARATGSTDSEYTNGGYFGPKALETLHRSFSGKSNFQEPSLTPITERSEWSNRNSAIYAGMSGYPVSATSSQFADVSQDDLNKQLAMLQKFRRGAWGGSDASQQSSSNSQHSGSPMTYVAPGGGLVFPGQIQASNSTSNLQNMSSSFNSFHSSNDSDPSPSVDSPTVTLASMLPASTQSAAQNFPAYSMLPPPPPPTAVQEPRRSSKAKGHSRNSSGAESVSYKEEGGKWVIEKRRMSETGEQMILGRSVVEGGRI